MKNTGSFFPRILTMWCFPRAGMVWELTSRGAKVEIWTICAGDPPEGRPLPEQANLMHQFWGIGDDVPRKRATEDAACCGMLGAAWRRFTVPDAIYRYLPGTDQPVVFSDDELMHDPEPEESYLIPLIADFIRKNLPEDCQLAAPLAIGSHRDHLLTRQRRRAPGNSPVVLRRLPLPGARQA